MIFDNISSIDKYQDDVKLYAALIALKHYVQGERYDETSVASFSLQECNTIPLEKAKLENHRKFIDIHYVVEGSENILINYSSRLERLTEYSEESDCELFSLTGAERCVEMQEGDFLVVYPGESHAPKIAINDEVKRIRKVVVKL